MNDIVTLNPERTGRFAKVRGGSKMHVVTHQSGSVTFLHCRQVFSFWRELNKQPITRDQLCKACFPIAFDRNLIRTKAGN